MRAGGAYAHSTLALEELSATTLAASVSQVDP
jgi:hypothetical protein